MEQRDNGLTYTDPDDVAGARVNYGGAYRNADLYGHYRTPGKRVTPYMLTLTGRREMRVYVNGDAPYVRVGGTDVLLDDTTQDTLAWMHAASESWEVASKR